jgi:phage tail sheath protein FI
VLESRRLEGHNKNEASVAERRVSGIEISEQGGADQAIDRVPTGMAAFVGRTLKGPVNRPTLVSSFAEFQQVFGGLWQPSTLAYAVEQYFENGGRSAYVVRVVNGARPPTLSLPAGGSQLRLIGVNPGTREYVRASVDYDGIGQNEPDRFNLVLQRVRAAGSELIEDQEIFRRLSIQPESGRFVSAALLESRLARVHGAVPIERPNRSLGAAGSHAVGYAHSNADGDDGGTLTDYDIIGSATASTGMFALKAVSGFNLLCIPPLSRDQDVGVGTLMVAARFCADQHALLVVDPPLSWGSAQTALAALRSWQLRTENAVMYYPRVLAFDRLRGRLETFGSCGAAAGMIARADEAWPVWAPAESDDAVLRPGLRPAFAVSDPDRARLAQAGINTLLAVRPSGPPLASPRTLAAGNAGATDWKYLSARRLALFISASVERGTRWMLFEQNGPGAWRRAQAQVQSFLDGLHRQGAFAGGEAEESYFAICDERVNEPHGVAAGKIKVLFGFAITRPSDFHAFLVTHHAGTSRCRPVSASRLATAPERLEWEIETAVLRGTSFT